MIGNLINYLSQTKEVSGFEMICFAMFVLILHNILNPVGVALYHSIKSLFRRK